MWVSGRNRMRIVCYWKATAHKIDSLKKVVSEAMAEVHVRG